MEKLNWIPSLLRRPLVLLSLLVVAVAVAAASYFMYQDSQKELAKVKSDPRSVAQQEAKTLVENIGRLVALPEGEEPTVATITDKERLKDQPFFAKAENGDKVLIYTQAKRAYLYSTKLNKVVEIAPVNIGTQAGQVAGQATEEKASPTPTKAPKK